MTNLSVAFKPRGIRRFRKLPPIAAYQMKGVSIRVVKLTFDVPTAASQGGVALDDLHRGDGWTIFTA